MSNFCEHQGSYLMYLWLAHSVLEYWLGKTEKTKAGSVIEALIMGPLKALLNKGK